MPAFLDAVIEQINQARGIDLGGYRRGLLERRLRARMVMVGLEDEDAYLGRLRGDPEECTRLIDALAINVSRFFRDPIVFEILAQSILPGIVDRKRRRGSQEIRAWSAGCAGGEEAYSLAILLHEALGEEAEQWRCWTFATDIDHAALEVARAGAYSRQSLEHTKLGMLDRHFTVQGEGFEVKPSLREAVRFSLDDLTSTERTAPPESVFGTFDLVLCRNLLIYFSRELQERVLEKLCRSLDGGGYLVLGDAEGLLPSTAGRLAPVDGRNRIFRKHPQAPAMRHGTVEAPGGRS